MAANYLRPEEKEKLKNIYAEGSPTEKVQSAMNKLTGADVVYDQTRNALNDVGTKLGNIVDTATTVTGGKFLQKGIDQLSNRITEDAARTRSAAYLRNIGRIDNQNELMREGSVPNFRTQTPITNNILASAIDMPNTTSRPLEYVPDPNSPIAPAPITGNPERSIRNTQEWLKVHKPGYDTTVNNGLGQDVELPLPLPGTYEGTLKDIDQAHPQKVAVTLRDINSGREIINGNVLQRINGNKIETIMPFPNAPGYSNGYRMYTPLEMKINNEVYQDKLKAYKMLNGEIPLNQAQARLADANALDVPVTSNRADKALNITEQKNKLMNEYIDPNTSEDRRSRIGEVLGIKGDSYDTIDTYDSLGMKTGQKIYSKSTGQIKRNQSGLTEMDVINSNPVYKKTFEEASDERKSQILKQLRERLASQQ